MQRFSEDDGFLGCEAMQLGRKIPSSALRKEAASSSEKLVNIYGTV
jgi:hypothetical protein